MFGHLMLGPNRKPFSRKKPTGSSTGTSDGNLASRPYMNNEYLPSDVIIGFLIKPICLGMVSSRKTPLNREQLTKCAVDLKCKNKKIQNGVDQ